MMAERRTGTADDDSDLEGEDGNIETVSYSAVPLRSRCLVPSSFSSAIETRITTEQRKRKFVGGVNSTMKFKRRWNGIGSANRICGDAREGVPVPYEPDEPMVTVRNRPPCRNYYGEGFCVKGDNCLFDHGLNPIVMQDSELAQLKVSTMFNANPPPPGIEVENSEKDDEDGAENCEMGKSPKMKKRHSGTGMLIRTTTTQQTSTSFRAFDRARESEIANAFNTFPTQLEMERQNGRLKEEAEWKIVRDSLIQLSRLKGDLYEKLVEQQKSAWLKLREAGNDEVKKRHLKALINRSEELKRKTKSELEELLRRLGF